MRENFAGCGNMILGSDSHTRYRALGTMAVGEGGGELAKQLLRDTYDMPIPTSSRSTSRAPRSPASAPRRGARHRQRRLYKRIRQEQGHGVHRPRHRVASHRLPQRHRRHDHRDHLPSSIWQTDGDTKRFDRPASGDDYRELKPARVAYYDALVEVDLSQSSP